MTAMPPSVEDVVDLRPGRLREAAAPGVGAAAQRLNASREALRAALTQSARPARRPAAAMGGNSLLDNLLLRIRNVPALAFAIDSTRAWWHEQPARAAAEVFSKNSSTLLAPVARRMPGSLLLAGFGVGAALVLLKPWRLLLRPSVLFGLVTRVATHAVKARFASSPESVRLIGSRAPPVNRAL